MTNEEFCKHVLDISILVKTGIMKSLDMSQMGAISESTTEEQIHLLATLKTEIILLYDFVGSLLTMGILETTRNKRLNEDTILNAPESTTNTGVN
jgi:hypothetical protein